MLQTTTLKSCEKIAGEYELEVRKMDPASFKDYYEILGVHRRASPKKIKKAYHSLAKKYHPDKSNFEENYAKQMMQDINEAYEVLGDRDKKAHYDRNFANAGFKRTPYAAEKKQKSPMGERVRQTSEFNHRTQYIKQISVQKYVKWFALGIVVTTMAIFSLKPLVQALLFNKDTGKRSNLHLQLAYRPKAPPAGIRMVTGEIAQSQPAPKGQNVQSKSGFFTLGSTLKDVQSVMGTPTNINGMIWCYGLSMVYFDIEGKVCGWQIIDIPLKISAGERDSNATFTTGSTKKEVVRAMGTPTGVDANTWLYGLSMVYFDGDGKVRGWVEIDKKLKLAQNAKPEGT